MSDVQHRFDELAERARSDVSPSVDVADAVWARIRHQPQATDRTMAIMASFSAAAAAVIVIYAGQMWSSWQDPLTELLNVMDPVLQ